MKFVQFRIADGSSHFGVQRDETVYTIASSAEGLGVDDYISSQDAVEASVASLTTEDARSWDVEEVRLLPALTPSAIIDCAVSPAHLRRSARTLLRRSLPVGIGHFVGPAVGYVVDRSTPRSGGYRRVPYYKGNPNSVSGDGDKIPWPDYTAYADIEPELAFVTARVPKGAGSSECAAAIRGYVIFNDASARDVQLAEMVISGLATSKDFDGGNGLGPWLVTPDEIPDPLALRCTVSFDSRRAPWVGGTSCYSMRPHEVLASLATRQTLAAGTVVGMGTIVGCCGLDRDEWIEPGEKFTINIEGLGTLRQQFSVPAQLPKTRWTPRRINHSR